MSSSTWLNGFSISLTVNHVFEFKFAISVIAHFRLEINQRFFYLVLILLLIPILLLLLLLTFLSFIFYTFLCSVKQFVINPMPGLFSTSGEYMPLLLLHQYQTLTCLSLFGKRAHA